VAALEKSRLASAAAGIGHYEFIPQIKSFKDEFFNCFCGNLNQDNPSLLRSHSRVGSWYPTPNYQSKK